MRDLINHWAHLIDESFNPDDHKSDKMDHEADKWEELQSEIAEINKKLDKHTVKEAEDEEDDDPDFKSAFDDPEFREQSAKSDAFMDKLDKTRERNEKIANGEDVGKIKDEISDQVKKWFVFEVIDQYEPGNTKKDIEKASSRDDIGNLKPGKTLFNKFHTEKCDTREEAIKYMLGEINKYSEKYGIKPEDFKKLHEKVEVKVSKTLNTTDNSGKRDIKRHTIEASGIPSAIKELDPNAVGFLYASSDIDGDGKTYIVGKEGASEKPDENEDYNVLMMEFICYNSPTPAIATVDGLIQLHDGIRKANDPDYQTSDQKRKEADAKYKEEMETLQQDMFEESVNQIESFIAKNDDDVLSEIVLPHLEGISIDDIGNLTADDIKEFGEKVVFEIIDDIWKYSEKKSQKDYFDKNVKTSKGDISKDVVDFLNNETNKENILKVFKPFFPVKKTGNEEEDKKEEERVENMVRNLTVDDIKDFSNDKMMAIRGRIWRLQDGKYLDKDEKVDFSDDNDTKDGMDGYKGRSDGKENEDNDEEDDENSAKDNRKDDDMDDYEGSQNATSVSYGKKSQTSKKESSLSLHGVKISKKVKDYWDNLPKEEKPKNAEEVKKMIKKVNNMDK